MKYDSDRCPACRNPCLSEAISKLEEQVNALFSQLEALLELTSEQGPAKVKERH